MRFKLIILLLFAQSVMAFSLSQLGCGISEEMGDVVMERKVALSRAIKNSFSSLLERVLGSELYLEVKDEFLSDLISNPERFILEYSVREEKKLEGGGYLVCVMVRFSRKVLFGELRARGILPEEGKREKFSLPFTGLKNYAQFKELRRRVFDVEGVKLFYLKEFFMGNGTIEVDSSLGELRFLSILKGICMDWGGCVVSGKALEFLD